MFYLQVEIKNFKQLKITIPPVINSLIRNIEKTITSAGGEKHQTLSRLYCFHSTFRETSLTVVNSAFQITEYLGRVAEKLYGFSIIISHSDSDLSDENLESKIKKFIYQIPTENCMWLLEDRKNTLENHIIINCNKGLNQIKKQKTEIPGTEERLRKFCRREAHVERIIDAVNAISKTLSESAVLHITGPLFTGKEYNLDESLKTIDSSDSVPLLFLSSCDNENPLDPFLWSINSQVEEKVSSYLDNDEQDLWRVMSSQLQLYKNTWSAEQCSDYLNKDFITLFSFYLKAYIKIRKENSLLPIIICKKIDSWKSESVQILNKLLHHFISAEGLLPICTSSNLQWAEDLKDLKMRTIHFSPYSIEDLKRGVESAFSDIHFDDEDINNLYKKTGGLTLPIFHSLLSYLEMGKISEKDNPAEGLLRNFDKLTLNLLFLLYMAKGLIPKEDYLVFFEMREYSRAKITERLEHLYMLRLIEGRDYPRPVYTELEVFVKSMLSESACELANSFTNHLFSMWEKGKQVNIENLYRIILRYGQTGKSLQVLMVLIDRFLNNKQLKLARHYFKDIFYKKKELSIGENDALRNIVFSGKMRAAMLEEDLREVQNIISESKIIKVHKKSTYSSQASLQYSIYMNSLGDYSRGLNLAKEALFSFQQAGNSIGEAKANIELAKALLGQGKIRTSQDYFEISRRASFQTKDLLSQIRSSFYKNLSDFIFGNIPMALRGVNDNLSIAEKAGRREWQVMIIHLKGRILFDLGRYRDCEDNYKEGCKIADKYDMRDASQLMTRWMARSLIYNERFKDGIEMLEKIEQSDEALFFLAEAAYFDCREDRALEYIQSAGSQYQRVDNIPGETPYWRDGFLSIEGNSLPRDYESDVLMNQIQAFRLYLMGINGDLNKAVTGFSELISRYNSQNSSHYFYKYFFLYSSVLPESFNDDEKHLKILSNSVKLLQSRAGRFDDQKMKHSFLNYNYWNKKITEESVKRNFI